MIPGSGDADLSDGYSGIVARNGSGQDGLEPVLSQEPEQLFDEKPVLHYTSGQDYVSSVPCRYFPTDLRTPLGGESLVKCGGNDGYGNSVFQVVEQGFCG